MVDAGSRVSRPPNIRYEQLSSVSHLYIYVCGRASWGKVSESMMSCDCRDGCFGSEGRKSLFHICQQNHQLFFYSSFVVFGQISAYKMTRSLI